LFGIYFAIQAVGLCRAVIGNYMLAQGMQASKGPNNTNSSVGT